MQRVIALIVELRASGIEVPPYPLLEGSPQPAQYDVDGAQLQARVDDFEARVAAWRKQVVALHSSHFPPQA